MDNHNKKNTERADSKLEQLNKMVKDVTLLANFAVESGRLPDQVSMAEIYRAHAQRIDDGMPLSASDIELLQYYYQLLKIELDPVTPTSLLATQCEFDHDAMTTIAGRRVKDIWYWAFTALALIFSINLYQYIFEFYSREWVQVFPNGFSYLSIAYWLALAMAPFAYGALGASLRILRIVERSLRDRSFDPRRLPEHRTRLVLGTISGGAIVILYSSGGISDTNVKLTEIALGFIAGYSIDFLFSLLDNVVSILTPSKSPANQSQQKARIQVPMKLSEMKKSNAMPEQRKAKEEVG